MREEGKKKGLKWHQSATWGQTGVAILSYINGFGLISRVEESLQRFGTWSAVHLEALLTAV
jgi:hypothetical protein